MLIQTDFFEIDKPFPACLPWFSGWLSIYCDSSLPSLWSTDPGKKESYLTKYYAKMLINHKNVGLGVLLAAAWRGDRRPGKAYPRSFAYLLRVAM
jgi:hypothetical protein